MRFYKPRYTVYIRRHEMVGEDYGNPVYGWGDKHPVQVYGWSSPRSAEPKLVGHDNRVTVDVEVFFPHDAELPHDRDKMLLGDGAEYDVVGRPEDYTHGPHGWPGGYVVNLREVSG